MQRLSCAPAEHDGAVAGLLVAASQGLKQRKLLVEEVAQFQAAALVAQLPYPGMLTASPYFDRTRVGLCCAM